MGEDLRPFISQIYNQDLGSLLHMRLLRIERCQIDFFQPKNLSEKIKIISLEGNNIAALDVILGSKMEEEKTDSDDKDKQEK